MKKKMTITKSLLDNAIASNTPITVCEVGGNTTFSFIVTSYDRRMVHGYYVYKGIRYDGTFHRTDLETA